MNKPSFSNVSNILRYNRKTGEFHWRVSVGRAVAGRPAGFIRKDGYVKIKINGKAHGAHQLAWLLCYGEWPKHRIDHKDNVQSHNWIDNLRYASHSQNMANRKRHINNTTGFKGVHQKPNGRYRTSVCKNNKRIWLGTFETAKEAHDAYCAAAVELHGEFARTA